MIYLYKRDDISPYRSHHPGNKQHPHHNNNNNNLHNLSQSLFSTKIANMVSLKLSMAAATAALLQVAAARKCSASVADYVGGGGGGGGFHEYKVYASFADDKDNKLDSQDSDNTKALVIYDGVQTLKSDKLGGDILLTASRNGKSGQSQLG